MFEPKTLTVPELAKRWDKTPRQIIEFAIELGIPLYFYFEGLVFNLDEAWLRHGGDWNERLELESNAESGQAYESWLSRAARGDLSDYDRAPTKENRQDARQIVDASKARCAELRELLAERDRQRMKRRLLMNLRTPPKTLSDLMLKGAAPVPRFAFHPGSPIKAVDGNWIGHMVALEPTTEADVWKPLREDALFAAMVEIKAVEARDFSETAHPPLPKLSKRLQMAEQMKAPRKGARADTRCALTPASKCRPLLTSIFQRELASWRREKKSLARRSRKTSKRTSQS